MYKTYQKKIVAFLIVIIAFIVTPMFVSYVSADTPEGNTIIVPDPQLLRSSKTADSGNCKAHKNPEKPQNPEKPKDRPKGGVYRGGGGNGGGGGGGGAPNKPASHFGNLPKVNLPAIMRPATEDASWKVSPATRNLRVEITPLRYDPAYGPSVHLTYVYIRERDSEDKWTCNYDSYMRSGPTSGSLGLANYSAGDEVQIQVTHPNGHTVEYIFDYEIESFITPENVLEARIYITGNRYDGSVFIIRKDNSYEEYSRKSRHGSIMSICDYQGHKVKFLRNSYGILESIVDAAGAITTVEHRGDVTTFTDPSGRKAEIDYNSYNGQLGHAITTSGTTNEFTYDDFSPYDSEEVLSELKIQNKTYTFVPAYIDKINEMGLYEWTNLTVNSDFGYSCVYDWQTNDFPVIDPGGNTTHDIKEFYESYCIRTDTDASGERKVKYQINDRAVESEEKFFKTAISQHWAKREKYYYDDKGQKTNVVKYLPDGTKLVTKMSYNDDGLLTSEQIITENGFQTVFSQSLTPFGEMISQTTPEGTIIYSFINVYNVGLNDETNWFNLISGIRQPGGETTLYEYDDKGRIVKETLCANPSTYTTVQNVIDSDFRWGIGGIGVFGSPFGSGTDSFTTYNISVTPNPSKDRVTTYTYGANNYPETATGPDGVTARFSYDNVGNLLEKEVAGDSGCLISRSYDRAGRLLAVEDSRAGNSSKFLYDKTGLASMTNAAGIAFDYSFDYAERELYAATPYGTTKAYGYPTNSGSPALWAADAYGTTTFSYADNFSPVKTVFPDGAEVNNVYNFLSEQWITETTNELGGVISYDYLNFGKTTIASNHVTGVKITTTVDLLDRTKSVSASDGSTANYIYNADKLVSSSVSDAGTINYGFNNFGELEWTKNQNNFIVSNFYDKTGFLVKIADSLGRTVTSTRYGASDLPESVIDTRGEITYFGYDSAFNNTTITPPDGITITKSHDLMGSVTSVVHGTSVAFTEYDHIGRVTSVSKKSAANKFIKVENFYHAAQPRPTKTRSFYEVSGTHTPRETSFTYNNRGRVTRIQDAAENVVETSYNGLGLITNVAIPTQLSHFEGGSRGMFASFTFDKAGRLIHEKDFHGKEYSISYNANERKTTVTRPDSTTVTTVKDRQVLSSAAAKLQELEILPIAMMENLILIQLVLQEIPILVIVTEIPLEN